MLQLPNLEGDLVRCTVKVSVFGQRAGQHLFIMMNCPSLYYTCRKSKVLSRSGEYRLAWCDVRLILQRTPSPLPFSLPLSFYCFAQICLGVGDWAWDLCCIHSCALQVSVAALTWTLQECFTDSSLPSLVALPVLTSSSFKNTLSGVLELLSFRYVCDLLADFLAQTPLTWRKLWFCILSHSPNLKTMS